jgi:hypothetical protein
MALAVIRTWLTYTSPIAIREIPMRSLFTFALALALTLAAMTLSAASAGHVQYKWKDTAGNLHFADILPAEALQLGYDVVDAQGRVIKHVDRPRTPEELKSDEAQKAQTEATKRETEERAKHDQQILAAYPHEQELVNAQESQLQMIDQNIQSTELSLTSQEKSLAIMLNHAASLDRSGKPVPADLRKQIDSLRKNIEMQKAYIVRRQKEKSEAAQKSAADLAHYRELQERTKPTPSN